MRRKLIYLAAVLTVVAAGSLATVKLHSPSSAGVGGDGAFPAHLGLSAPAFAQGAPTDKFPYTEAGISCYVKFQQTVDLQRAQRSLRVIEDATADYVIGVIALEGSDQSMWPHVYVTKDGWVLVYYSKSDPTSKVMQWSSYSAGAIKSTTLRDALLTLEGNAGLDPSKADGDLKYFHFQYPEATRLLVVADSVDGSHRFYYTVTSGLTVYDASWSQKGVLYSGYANMESASSVDGEELQYYGGGTREYFGTLPGKWWRTPDQRHQVDLRGSYGVTYFALCFVYR